MNTRRLTWVLAGLAMIGPFATDTYLPSFLNIAQHFNVSQLLVQQTLSVYLFAYSLMTLFYGTLSDSFGRRPIILSSLVIFGLGSLGAMIAHSFTWLLVFRAIQGLSAGAGMVVGQAIVRDSLTGPAAQRMVANIMMVFGIAPAVAPVVGGYLNAEFGWRANFALLAILATMLLLVCIRALPESLEKTLRQPFHPTTILRNYSMALRHPKFIFGALAIGFAFSGFALYISSAANFVIQVLHLPPTAFAWLFIPMIGGMALGSGLGGKLAHALPATVMIRTGFAVMVLGALINLCYTAMFVATVPWAVLPIFVYSFGMALALPGMSVMTLGIFPQMRGLASSLQNFAQMLIFAMVSGFVAPALFGSAFKLAEGLATGVLVSLASWVLHSRHYARISVGNSSIAPGQP